MEKKDLRIGNLVSLAHESNQPFGEVCAINGDDTFRIILNGEEKGCYGLDRALPIPLTDAWKDKCELEDFPLEIFGDNRRGFHVSLENGSWVFIASVHHLQNLYHALMEKELIIKL